MRLGLLADIHEAVPELEAALAILKKCAVDRIVVLGDIVETGSQLAAVTKLLAEHGAFGVWGNHDFGIAYQPEDAIRMRYSDEVMRYMTGLAPRLEIGDCLFTHVEPWLDPTDFFQLWRYEGEPVTVEQAAKSFECTAHRFLFVGHFHRWRVISDCETMNWDGTSPLDLSKCRRGLISVGALCNGKFAIFDTESCELIPMRTDEVK
ncbi:MAG TPA: metallophosphoesterase family protein [Lacipirellulaceae bacterium]|jgi:hypothetical protein|nr:metallophosphoesterase family protein [Lacipirellulaceae bacterium]